jgi:hypothetical protein
VEQFNAKPVIFSGYVVQEDSLTVLHQNCSSKFCLNQLFINFLIALEPLLDKL